MPNDMSWLLQTLYPGIPKAFVLVNSFAALPLHERLQLLNFLLNLTEKNWCLGICQCQWMEPTPFTGPKACCPVNAMVTLFKMLQAGSSWLYRRLQDDYLENPMCLFEKPFEWENTTMLEFYDWCKWLLLLIMTFHESQEIDRITTSNKKMSLTCKCECLCMCVAQTTPSKWWKNWTLAWQWTGVPHQCLRLQWYLDKLFHCFQEPSGSSQQLDGDPETLSGAIYGFHMHVEDLFVVGALEFGSIIFHHIPIASMYGIFTYIYHKDQPNVGKYT